MNFLEKARDHITAFSLKILAIYSFVFTEKFRKTLPKLFKFILLLNID